jgi:hypothetical protein
LGVRAGVRLRLRHRPRVRIGTGAIALTHGSGATEVTDDVECGGRRVRGGRVREGQHEL